MLKDEDVKQLEDLLGDDDIPVARMPLEAVDGLIAASLCGPKPIQRDDWMPRIWRDRPIPEDHPKTEILNSLLLKLHSETYYWLSREQRYQPIFLKEDFEDEDDRLLATKLWAVGFMHGHKMHGDKWQGLPRQIREAMSPIFLLGMSDEHIDKSGLLDPGEDKYRIRQQLIDTVPFAVSTIYKHWHPEVQPDKVGRNEPCPCGSGRKYKKCCGTASTLH